MNPPKQRNPGILRNVSLRALMGVAALATLLSAAVLGLLLVATANSARRTVQAAEEAHDRVQAYSMLTSAVRSFHVSSYAVAHLPSPQNVTEHEATRARLLADLDAALRLPRDTPQRAAVAEKIDQQSRYMIEHLARAREIVQHIDEVWRTEGSRAAGTEAELAGRPVRALEETLDAEIRRGDEEIEASTNRALRQSRVVILACILCLCLAAGCWVIVYGLLLRRVGPGLRRLEEGTRAFAAGDLAHRVNLGGHDELAHLSAAFDAMAEQLMEKQQALQQVHTGLERAVRDRTEELERVNRELSASDGRRRAFLADIGHELRTPLTIIRGEAQVGLRTLDAPDFKPQEVFERIIKQTHDVSRMVEDLFLIARAEAGGLPMQLKRVDLRELTCRVAGDFEALVVDGGAAISAVEGPAVFWVVDPDRLRRALAALIENALRHTHGSVSVVIEARQTPEGVIITVSDDGPGIDPTLVPELFQRFRRGHTQAEGSGLGLSLVRALVEAQGGQVRLENRAEGGLRAVLEFRRARAEERERGSNYEPAAG